MPKLYILWKTTYPQFTCLLSHFRQALARAKTTRVPWAPPRARFRALLLVDPDVLGSSLSDWSPSLYIDPRPPSSLPQYQYLVCDIQIHIYYRPIYIYLWFLVIIWVRAALFVDSCQLGVHNIQYIIYSLDLGLDGTMEKNCKLYNL